MQIRKNKKRKSLNEFRYNYNTRHTQYVFEEDDKRYRSLGLTHHKRTKGIKNMPLSKNPQKGKTEKAYIRYGIINDTKNNYSGIDKRFKFSKEDFVRAKSKIRKYKSRRRYK